MNALFHTAFLSLSATALTALDYQGADVILKQIAQKAMTKPAVAKADPVEELRLKIKTLRQEGGFVAPAEAAKRWLTLLDAYLTIPADQLYSQRSYEDRLSLSIIISSLPPPAAWDEISRLLSQRKTSIPMQDEGLRLLIAVLLSDEAGRTKCLNALRQKINSQKDLDESQRENHTETLDQLTEALESHARSDATLVAAFEKNIALLEKGDAKTKERFEEDLDVPDLVRFAGEKSATVLLNRTLKLGVTKIDVEGRTTKLLAAKLALEQIDTLKKPLWNLVHNLDHAPLYEALEKKFPDSKDHYRQNAAQVYLLALIAADRVGDAVALVREEALKAKEDEGISIDVDGLEEMGRSGLGTQVLAFLQRLLAEDPAMPYWSELIELAARQNAAPTTLKLMRESLAKPSLGEKARSTILQHHYQALLAADEREEGVRVLRDLVKAGPQSGTNTGEDRAQELKKRWEQVGVHVSPEMLQRFQRESRGSSDGGETAHLKLVNTLANLGRLLEKPELIEEALSAATATVEKMSPQDSNRESMVHTLAELLLEHQRGPQAEALLAAHLSLLVTPDEKQRGRPRMEETLGLLAHVYQQAGRHADVIALLENSPHWAAPDLAAFESTNVADTPLLLIAARSLAETGRTEDARRIINRAAQDYPAKDSVYELLIKLNGSAPTLVPMLDQLFKRDRFEERPLIWKARVLLDAGKTDEAETAIRAAIAIDPSDGEQGKGDRMRAYAILAEVLDKKGDPATAKIMRGAVSAIRKSEAADDWWSAGLLGEAVRRYEAALLDFADAYCIQSRLALRYSELGQFEKAEQHYLRAYELMPESFGRVESHCFGCERAFKGQRAQSVAEKVFTRLANTPPVKAQVHYLLGYVRDSQNRSLEAADAYRLAVMTDPDYLNAWKKLASVADTTNMSREESDNIALQIFRLDPAGHHSSADLGSLRDLRKLWTTLLEAEKNTPPTEIGPLLPLTAAKTKISAQIAAENNNAWDTWSYPSLFSRRTETRLQLIQNPLLQPLINYIDNLNRN